MATAEAEVQQEAQVITFESEGANYRIIRRDAVSSTTPQGATYEVMPAVYIDFEPNGLVEFKVGEQPLDDGPARMENGRPVYDAFNRPVREVQDAVHYLINHREFGVRFWVKGLEPGTPLPLPADFISEVVDAQFGLKIIKLQRMREQEIATHGRPELMMMVDNAIRVVIQERERLGEEAPTEDPDEPIPSGNSPFDLMRRPAGMAEADAHAQRAAALAQPDDPRYAGGVQ